MIRLAKCEVCGKVTKTKCNWKRYCSQKCRLMGFYLMKVKEFKNEKLQN